MQKEASDPHPGVFLEVSTGTVFSLGAPLGARVHWAAQEHSRCSQGVSISPLFLQEHQANWDREPRVLEGRRSEKSLFPGPGEAGPRSSRNDPNPAVLAYRGLCGRWCHLAKKAGIAPEPGGQGHERAPCRWRGSNLQRPPIPGEMRIKHRSP